MTQPVSQDIPVTGVVRLALDAPPGNALDAEARRALDTGLAAALADAGTRAIVIAGRGREFSIGRPVDEHGCPSTGPGLDAICARLDAAHVPVVVALNGPALDGGAELALAAHYRVALKSAHLAFPAIAMGLPPSAGSTQRLPRMTVPGVALDLLLTGRPLDAVQASAFGLVDAVVEDDLEDAAVRFAQGLVEERAGPRPASARPLPAFDALHEAVMERRARLDPESPVRAPALVLDCVEATAMLIGEAALAYEAAAYEDCADSAEFRALRRLTLAERRVRQEARAWSVAGSAAQTVGIWGWGSGAAALAATVLATGATVRLAAPDEARLTEGVGEIDALLTSAQVSGRMDEATYAGYWSRLSGARGMRGLSGCDLVIEAGAGGAAEREKALAELAVAAGGAVIAATGPLSNPKMQAVATRRPADTLWLNLPDFVAGARLAELVTTPKTGVRAVAVTGTLMQRLGRLPLIAVEESPTLAVLVGALEAADALVEEGASPYDIDVAMRSWGFGSGPYEMADRLGLETLLALRARLPDGDDPTKRPVLLLGQLVSEGRTGPASGYGYYAYPDEGFGGEPDPGLVRIAAEMRDILGRETRDISPDTIQAQVLAGMVQAGARLLRRGAVRRPADIDLALVHGTGLARWRGGPMQAADEAGLLAVRRTLRTMAERGGEAGAALWTPDPLIADLIKDGRCFADLNRPAQKTGDAVSPA